ncbi:hypothetical protein HS961_10350 [Comamonas piscis]|uniref:Uncharacterized protein n=1 Tax=Comamonas piscis TaxID=1562974 RepID=A0A7G5EBH2_9BURK|nr:hypothetical protein [Comamonas piscis]QMV71347.1 hypothetical protein HS961_10350 [Comamonas piscis]WSO35991.1 hypothetical protein VUJ63_10380 [Comamonas piscis]
MVITLNPLLKVSAGQWNTLVNFASALCGLPDQICIGTNTQLPDGGQDALFQLDVELNGSNSIFA